MCSGAREKNVNNNIWCSPSGYLPNYHITYTCSRRTGNIFLSLPIPIKLYQHQSGFFTSFTPFPLNFLGPILVIMISPQTVKVVIESPKLEITVSSKIDLCMIIMLNTFLNCLNFSEWTKFSSMDERSPNLLYLPIYTGVYCQ